MSNETRTKLFEIVSAILEIDPEDISFDTSPETIAQWDSLNHVTICMALSEEFDVPFTTEQMASVRNVGDLAQLLSAAGFSCEG